MKELPAGELLRVLTEHAANTLWIVAPNYEPRSVEHNRKAAQSLLEENWQGTMVVLQFTTEPSVAPLETLKEIAVDEMQPFIKQGMATLQRFSYPSDSLDTDIRRHLAEVVKRIRQPRTMVIDITALPRRVIRAYLSAATSLNIEKLFATYSWARRYPGSSRPSAVGSLVGLGEATEVHNILKASESCAALILPGRQGFDARQLQEAVTEAGGTVTVAAFFDESAPMLSLETTLANSRLFRTAGTPVQYYFTIGEAWQVIYKWRNDSLTDNRDLLLVAPFGPKPLLVASLLAMRGLDKDRTNWDIVLLRQPELNSTYSIGVGRLSLFDLTHV